MVSRRSTRRLALSRPRGSHRAVRDVAAAGGVPRAPLLAPPAAHCPAAAPAAPVPLPQLPLNPSPPSQRVENARERHSLLRQPQGAPPSAAAPPAANNAPARAEHLHAHLWPSLRGHPPPHLDSEAMHAHGALCQRSRGPVCTATARIPRPPGRAAAPMQRGVRARVALRPSEQLPTPDVMETVLPDSGGAEKVANAVRELAPKKGGSGPSKVRFWAAWMKPWALLYPDLPPTLLPWMVVAQCYLLRARTLRADYYQGGETKAIVGKMMQGAVGFAAADTIATLLAGGAEDAGTLVYRVTATAVYGSVVAGLAGHHWNNWLDRCGPLRPQAALDGWRPSPA
ncbi:unnamed protein product [Pedinophyceae sp. YPF-701]|nr:unnamed protein product [Pedinophyceae sp. YPF-701]